MCGRVGKGSGVVWVGEGGSVAHGWVREEVWHMGG